MMFTSSMKSNKPSLYLIEWLYSAKEVVEKELKEDGKTIPKNEVENERKPTAKPKMGEEVGKQTVERPWMWTVQHFGHGARFFSFFSIQGALPLVPRHVIHIMTLSLVQDSINHITYRCTTSVTRILKPDANCTTSVTRFLKSIKYCTTSAAGLLNQDACCRTSVTRFLNSNACCMMSVTCIS